MNKENQSKWEELWTRFGAVKKMEAEIQHSAEWRGKVVDDLVAGLENACQNAYHTYYVIATKLAELDPKMLKRMQNVSASVNLGIDKGVTGKENRTIDLFINCSFDTSASPAREGIPFDGCNYGILLNTESVNGNLERYSIQSFLENNLERFFAVTSFTPGNIESKVEALTDALVKDILSAWQKEVKIAEGRVDYRYKDYEQWVHTYKELDPEGAKAFQSSIPTEYPTPVTPATPVFSKNIVFGSAAEEEPEKEEEEDKELGE